MSADAQAKGSRSRRGTCQKSEFVVGVVFCVLFAAGGAACLLAPWPYQLFCLIPWALGALMGGPMLTRRIVVTDDDVIEHQILFLTERYPRKDIAAVSVRSCDWGQFPAAGPNLVFKTRTPDHRMPSLNCFTWGPKGRAKAEATGQWLAEQLGVPLTIEFDRHEPSGGGGLDVTAVLDAFDGI